MYYLTIMAETKTYAMQRKICVDDGIPISAGIVPSAYVFATLWAAEQVCKLTQLPVGSSKSPEKTYWVLIDGDTVNDNGNLRVVIAGNTSVAKTLFNCYMMLDDPNKLAGILTKLLNSFKPNE